MDDVRALQRRLAAMGPVWAERARIEALRRAAGREAQGFGGVAPRWYVLRIATWVDVVADALTAAGVEVFAPRLKILKRKSSSRAVQVIEVPLFERYLFVRVNPVAAAFAGLMTFDGVACILGTGQGMEARPFPVPDRAIADIQALCAAPAKKPSPERMLIGGDRVRVSAGPFIGLTGMALGPESAAGHVDIELDVFGRLTPCRMALDDLEKLA